MDSTRTVAEREWDRCNLTSSLQGSRRKSYAKCERVKVEVTTVTQVR